MNRPRTQRGLVLVVTLIMLALVTLMASVSASLILSNLKVVQNVEWRSAVRSAAFAAIQEAISTPGFLPPFAPGQQRRAFTVSCNGSPYTRCLDLSGDEKEDDVVVELSPLRCVGYVPAANSSFDYLNDVESRPCYVPKSRVSACGNAVLEFTATAIDAATGARVEIRQGVSVTTTENDIASMCPEQA